MAIFRDLLAITAILALVILHYTIDVDFTIVVIALSVGRVADLLYEGFRDGRK